MRSSVKIVNQGYALCHNEPRGEHGLEGYLLGSLYKYQLIEREEDGKQWYRVYTSDRGVYPESRYYETVACRTFGKYFTRRD